MPNFQFQATQTRLVTEQSNIVIIEAENAAAARRKADNLDISAFCSWTDTNTDYDNFRIKALGVTVIEDDLAGRIVTLSSSHVRPPDLHQLSMQLSVECDDHDTLERPVPGGFAVPIAAGWMIRAFGDPWVGGEHRHPYSGDFRKLIAWARCNGFGWLRIDHDAKPRADLPTFSF